MGFNNLVFGSHALHNIVKAYVKVLNSISTFVEPNTQTDIFTNDNSLTQYIIKQGLKCVGKKSRLQYKNNCSSFMTAELLVQRSLKTLAMNNK